ncbi:MAG: YdaS family helix-turn-helix protein [Chromatiaceae bacterium]
MNIRTYLSFSGTTQETLAAKLGVSQGTIAHWVSNRVRIPAERCRSIAEATGGLVTVYELRPDVFGQAPDAPLNDLDPQRVAA